MLQRLFLQLKTGLSAVRLMVLVTLLGLVIPAGAAQVNVLNSTSVTASGAGVTGMPSVSSFNIPAGKNRILFIFAAFERDHCDQAGDVCNLTNGGIGLSDNFPRVAAANQQITARVIGSAGSIDKKNALTVGGIPSGDLRFSWMEGSLLNSSGVAIPNSTLFNADSYHIALYENEINALLGGASSGNVSISLPDVPNPKNAGDDALLMAFVFSNADQGDSGIVRSAVPQANGNGVGLAGNFTLSGSFDAGQAPNDANDGLLVVGVSSLGQPVSAGGFLTMSGYAQVQSAVTNNSGGRYDNEEPTWVTTEPDGMSASAQFRNGIASSYTIQSAGASSLKPWGGWAPAFTVSSDNADASDAPASYGTPTHTISGVRLGASVDADAVILASSDALGDDSNGTDDENGVTMPASLTAGQTTSVPVNIQSASGRLSAWFDWNQDGDFLDAGEQVANDLSVAVGTTNLSVSVPANAAGGTTFARFRVCGATGQCNTPTSVATTGEVEDYTATVSAPADYGDAPIGYGAPSHTVVAGIRLGAVAPDTEAVPQYSVNATGDDLNGTDDEDGVTFSSLIQGQNATIAVNVTQASANSGYLQGWIDWNGDGDFADSGEQVATNLQYGAGTTGIINIPVTVPANATTNQTYARFRWSTTQGLNSTVLASDGEVEDYALTVAAPVIVNCPTEAAGSGSGYATSGTGLYKNDIFWLDWSCGAVTQFNPGDTINKSWTLANGLQINAQINTITAAIAPYNTGNWGGDTLDDLYSGVNPIGLTNVTDSQDPTYTVSFSASLNGVSIPADIVTAEAEDSGHSNESATWITDGSAWQPIEAFGALSAQFTNAGKTLFMNNDPDAGGGTLLAFSRDVSNIAVDMKAGGKEALAFGIFSSFDYGDIKAGYPASQGHYMRKLASGGSTPSALTPVSGLTMATLSNSTTFYLGATQPDAETADQNSVAADADGAEEDGVTIPTLTQGQTATITATVAGAGGYLQGWIDWNGDGDFADAGEQVATNIQDNLVGDTNNTAGTIAFNVAVPAGATSNQTYARFRWSSTMSMDATTVAADGEVEDYALTIVATANISGTLYRDGDFDAVFDAGETTLPTNISVLLFNDANNDNVPDSGEVVATAQTDAAGLFTFNNLLAGTYKIRVDTTDADIPPGYVWFSKDSYVKTVTATAGVTLTDQNFAFVTPDNIAATGRTCQAEGGTLGTNLFTLGNFGTVSSNTPGTSLGAGIAQVPAGFTYHDFNGAAWQPDNGLYTIVNKAVREYGVGGGASGVNAVPAWHGIGDRSMQSNGGVMIVNASISPDVFYQETLAVTPDTNYGFSSWAMNLITPAFDTSGTNIKPNIIFEAKRTGIDADFVPIIASGNIAPTERPTWNEYGGMINSGAATQITFRIRNNISGGQGNDLALDDLVLAPCTIPSGAVTGTLYRDMNGNHAYNAGTDITLPANIAVNLTNSSDAIVATVYTDANGAYAFNNIPVDVNYKIAVDLADSDIPAGATPTANPSGASTSGQQTGVTITANTTLQDQNFGFSPQPRDYGDAPAGYGAPFHTLVAGIYLGTVVPDDEVTPQYSVNADGDDSNGTDDEDGVTFPTLVQGQSATITATVAGAGGYLQGWIDWNGDGDFDTNEKIAPNLQDNGASDLDSTTGVIRFAVSVPTYATTSQTFARFRWSTTSDLDATTAANDGEVEDYPLTVGSAVASGSSACRVSTHGAANGANFVWPGGSNSTVSVTTNNSWSATAVSASFYDAQNLTRSLSGSRRWDKTGDMNLTLNFSTPIPAKEIVLYITDIGHNVSVAYDPRLTLTLNGGASPADFVMKPLTSGEAALAYIAATGTVMKQTLWGTNREHGVLVGQGSNLVSQLTLTSSNIRSDDFVAYAVGANVGCDFGDAPDNAGTGPATGDYQTLQASGGPVHYISDSSVVYLGAGATTEQDALQNVDATGDADDGITLPTLTQGQATTITATVNGASAYLQGWLDWNGDGDFADAGEQVATDLLDNGASDTDAAAGIIAFNVNVPSNTTTAQTYARFRWSSTSGLGATTAASDGEVEDYALTVIAKGTLSGTVFRDDDQSNLQNGAEPGIGLITVSLYRDNGTPADVTDDTLVTTVETAANGTYTFPDLDPGTYRVNVDTTDSDLPVGALIGTSHPRTGVTVTAGNTTTVDFGFDIFTCTPGGGGATDAAISPYISKEVSGTGVASRNETDTLDDTWRSAAGLPTSGKIVPWLGTTARSLAASEPALFSTYGVAVDVTRVNIQPASPCLGSEHTSGASLSTAATMQDVAPRPASLYDTVTQPAFWTDTGGDNQTPNAVRFTFATPVKSFGAWFGDLETRTDGYARPAWLRLLDSSGNRIGGDIPVTPTDLHNGTTTTAVNQNLCGSTTPGTDTACGNQSSRWVGFVDSATSARIKHVVVIVGDDDFGDDAGTELLSFIGMDIVQEDFGDAPASYGDASHWLAMTPKAYLGTTAPDKENQSQNTANGGADGTGDDTAGSDDEDGIANFPVLANGAQDYSLNVTVNNTSGSPARLVGWLDFNRNGVFDTSEAATVNVPTGASNKIVALTWNNLPADTTPGNSYLRLRLTTDSSIATGTASTSVPTGTAQDGEVEDYAITIGDSGFTLSGKVYNDTNVNGINDAAEKGIKDVTIVLQDTAAGSCRSTKTGADGSYHFDNVQPAAADNYVLYEAAKENHQAPTVCPPEVNDPNGYVSTTDNTLTVTVTNADVTDQDFGDAKLPTFTLENTQVILPYTTVAYPHIFQAKTDGSVSFSLAETAKPTGLEWGVSLLLDNNCDAQLDNADTVITGSINVTAGDKLCLLAKVLAPANATSGASHTLDITSSFVFGDGSSGLAVVEQTRTDITKTSSGTSSEPVGGEGKLSLQKSVWNTTRDIDGSVALPGETLRYTIAYENIGNGELDELVVNDTVPAFTQLGGAGQGCGTTPPELTACTPTQNGTALDWSFTGKLKAGSSGEVFYEVVVD
ncbi:hypothetical protein SAMN05660964_00405 [Thiothrix caldifontis]|uniref:Cna protein B-type domain-containing protein n=1 Tax=Thiothrix caldifontis TaxID=525918 RepID=A0A1H3WDK5_9GAMM|nr:CshA/CshB family fibrillar adhesin-related protein [Thiothrix caldifontis]SDZ85216.1 hypothetical protein SAMN05660964_00405 [Thiothrix caldifontis]